MRWGALRLAVGRGVRHQSPGVRCGEEWENGSCCVGLGMQRWLEQWESPVEVPGTAMKPTGQWPRAQAPITLP